MCIIVALSNMAEIHGLILLLYHTLSPMQRRMVGGVSLATVVPKIHMTSGLRSSPLTVATS